MLSKWRILLWISVLSGSENAGIMLALWGQKSRTQVVHDAEWYKLLRLARPV